MLKNGWVKIFRSLQDWQWWSDEKMVKFFIYLLINANIEDKYINGILVPRGTLMTSYSKLSRECNFTIKQLRGMLDKLVRTGEVAKQTYPKFTIITVNNYSQYQGEGREKGKQRASSEAGKRAGKGQQRKKDNNYLKKKEGADAPNVLTDEKGSLPEGFSTWKAYYDYLSE